MIKYNLVKNSTTVKKADQVKEGCTINHDGDQFNEVIRHFDTEEEALKALNDYKSTAIKYDGYAGTGSFYKVEEYYIEENEYNEDGDLCDSLGVIKFSPIGVNGKYKTAQAKATAKYMADKHMIRVVVTKAKAEEYKQMAEAQGKSLNQFIIDCIEEKG